jgi:hypothetical protein
MDKAHDPIASLIIDGNGGTKAVAELCDCSDAAVSMWRTKGMPRPRVQFLRLAKPNFDWSQVPDDYPPREPKPEIAERIKSSDDAQSPTGGTSDRGTKEMRERAA